jgi:hypothetical protein
MPKVIQRNQKRKNKRIFLNSQVATLKPNELCITKCCTEMALLAAVTKLRIRNERTHEMDALGPTNDMD